MTNEIKEILDKPKILMLSYGNYISLDDYVKLKDYITNLQEENEKLNIILQGLVNQKYEEKCKKAKIVHIDYVTKEKLQERINKALHFMNHVEEYDYRLFIDRLEKILEGDK